MAIVIILGICFMPGIYAWLNIASNWGPYDNTGNLPLAIVNKDKGTTILGESVNQSFVNTIVYKAVSKADNVDIISKSNKTTDVIG